MGLITYDVCKRCVCGGEGALSKDEAGYKSVVRGKGRGDDSPVQVDRRLASSFASGRRLTL